MISKCMDCSEYKSCNMASGIKNAMVLVCPYYVKGERNPCETMKMIGDIAPIVAHKEGSRIRRTAGQIVEFKNDEVCQIKDVFKSLPSLFTATEFKEACIMIYGKKCALTRDIKKNYLKSNGKGFYINQKI